MNSMIASFFLAIVLLFRLLPLTRVTNVVISVIAGALLFIFGLAEYREKGWKALGIAIVGVLFVIFSFFPSLNVGTPFIVITIILSIIVIILTILSEVTKPKKEEAKKEA